MNLDCHDTRRAAESYRPPRLEMDEWGYRVDVPADLLDEHGRLIDWLVRLAFDTHGAVRLDIRVIAPRKDTA